MIDDYINWTGTRRELISLINLFEKQNPKLYKMFSKQIGKYSPVNDRRIQQFIDEGIIPKPIFQNKKYFSVTQFLYMFIFFNTLDQFKSILETKQKHFFKIWFCKSRFFTGI